MKKAGVAGKVDYKERLVDKAVLAGGRCAASVLRGSAVQHRNLGLGFHLFCHLHLLTSAPVSGIPELGTLRKQWTGHTPCTQACTLSS